MESMLRRPRLALPWTLALVPLLAAACQAAGTAPGAPQSSGGKEKEKDAKDDPDTVELLALDIAINELELEAAKVGAASKRAEAEVALRMAEAAALQARTALEAFRSTKRVLQTDEAELDLAVARGNVEDASAELGELEAMYAAEEFAETTKELVLARGRRNLDQAKKRLDLRQRKLSELTSIDLPKEERELERALEEADTKVSQARDKKRSAEIEADISVRKAEKSLREARKKLEDAEKAAAEKAEESR